MKLKEGRSDTTNMKNTLDSLVVDPVQLPDKNEIKNYCKRSIIQNPEVVEELHKLDNKLLHDCTVWLEGYALGVANGGEFKHPLDEQEVKEFYLEQVFQYVLNRILE